MTIHSTEGLKGAWVEGLNVNGSTEFQSDGFLVASTSGLGCLSLNTIRFKRISLFMDPMWLIGSTFHHLTAPKEEGTKRGIGRRSNKRGWKNTNGGGGILFVSQCSKLFSFSYFLLLASNHHGRFHSDS
jgi:hypothetical protein